MLKNIREDSVSNKDERVYLVPFAGKGNAIRLQVANGSPGVTKGLEIKVKGIPEWIEMNPTLFTVGDLSAQKNATASFTFHVDKEAPINKKTTLRFVAESANGYNWEKELSLSVEAPTEVKLNHNYPNPFNPSTNISYRLPKQMQVKVTVYNILGRKVAVLADELQKAGEQTLRWDASRYASGVYFYRIIAEGNNGQQIVRSKKMLLIK